MSNPPPQGWPRPILDSGTPRRTMVLRHPQTRAYQSDRASRTACRTATHPADHTPRNPTRESEKFMPSPLTNVSPYQLVGATLRLLTRTRALGLSLAFACRPDATAPTKVLGSTTTLALTSKAAGVGGFDAKASAPLA